MEKHIPIPYVIINIKISCLATSIYIYAFNMQFQNYIEEKKQSGGKKGPEGQQAQTKCFSGVNICFIYLAEDK